MSEKKKAGRPKGSFNRDRRPVFECLSKMGVDPVETLAHYVSGNWKALGYPSETFQKFQAGGIVNDELYIQPETRVAAAKELIKYVHPQLKSIEHTGLDGGPIKIKEMSIQDRENKLRELLERQKNIDAK